MIAKISVPTNELIAVLNRAVNTLEPENWPSWLTSMLIDGIEPTDKCEFTVTREAKVQDRSSAARPEVPATGRTNAEIVAQTEWLAAYLMRETYQRVAFGEVALRYSTNPRAQHCWRMACAIQEGLTATDPMNAVAEIDGADAIPDLAGT
ncbi:MAG: hypothetical protein ABI574_13315 [Burkholderiales bacterium]